jgi:glycosyl transferase family 25
MHVYCINLERRADRRETVNTEFLREGIDVEFFPATDGRVEAPSGIYTSPSEYGCAMSHVRVWRDMVAKGYDMALVCEDDVFLVPNFKSKLENIVSEANTVPWDFLHLGPITPVKKCQVTESLYEGQPLGTHAYVIRLDCAKKISVFEPELMKVGIDFQINRFPIRFLCVNEPIAKQELVDNSPLTGVLKSWITGDIGVNRTVEFTHFIRLIFQRFKPIIILSLLILVIYIVR